MPGKRKIAHLSSAHPATDHRVFFKEARSLKCAGYEVVVIARASRDMVQEGIRIRAVRVGGSKRLLRMSAGVLQVLRLAIDERAEIYHLHDPELLPLGLILKVLGKRVIYDSHEDMPASISAKYWIPRHLRSVAATTTAMLEKNIVRAFDGIIVANPAQAKPFPAAKTVAVQNFPTIQELPDQSSVTSYQQRDNVVSYIGHLSIHRGLYEMVRAIEQVNEGIDAQLILAGRFTPDALQEIVSKEEVGWGHTTYLGLIGREELVNTLAQSRIGLAVLHPTPNYRTNQPVKIFEYMLAGIPVVASNFAQYRPFVADIGAGLMVDPLNPRQIAEAISWLFRNPLEAEEMGRRGRRAVLEMFNWEREEEVLIEFYRKILRENGSDNANG